MSRDPEPDYSRDPIAWRAWLQRNPVGGKIKSTPANGHNGSKHDPDEDERQQRRAESIYITPEVDPLDWVNQSIDEGYRSPPSKAAPGAAQGPDSTIVDPVLWEGLEIPARHWLVPGLIPYHVPTMLAGKGGLGKTLLGAQLVHSAATSLPWLGKEIEQCKALGVFCEDDEPELHRRFYDINTGTNTRFDDLGDLRLIVRTGHGSQLLNFDGPFGEGSPAPFLAELNDQIGDFGAKLILLDSLYNFFHGNENNRVQVTQFIYALRQIAIDHDAALVFLAHPSKSGLSTGDGYAGSTAWHDAVRSRLYLTEEKLEDGGNRLVLETMKANYSAKAEPVELHYSGGMLLPTNIDAIQPAYRGETAQVAFLMALNEMRSQGRNVSDAPNSKSFAPKFLRQCACCSGFSQKDLSRAMDELFSANVIVTKTSTDGFRNKVKGIFQIKDRVSSENYSA